MCANLEELLKFMFEKPLPILPRVTSVDGAALSREEHKTQRVI